MFVLSHAPFCTTSEKALLDYELPRAKILGLNSLFPAAPGQYLVWLRGSIFSPWLKLAKI